MGKHVSCQPAPSSLQLSSSTLDSAVTALQAGQVHSHCPQATPTPTGSPNTPPVSLDSFCKIPGLRSWATGVLGWKQKSGLINYNTCALFQETPKPCPLTLPESVLLAQRSSIPVHWIPPHVISQLQQFYICSFAEGCSLIWHCVWRTDITWGSWFSPPSEPLRFNSTFVASVFTHRAILQTQISSF